MLSRELDLAAQALEVVTIFIRFLGVARIRIMSAAPRKVAGPRMICTGQRAIGNTVAINVRVTPETLLLHLLSSKHLAAIDGLGWILKRFSHPLVHAQVQITEHKHRGLILFCNIERAPAEFKTLVDRPRQEADVLSVTVAGVVADEQVALRNARWHAGAWTYTLNIPDYPRNLCVVTEAKELLHQADARPGCSGHRACTSPARAQHHANRSQLILSLHNRVVGLAIWIPPQATGK